MTLAAKSRPARYIQANLRELMESVQGEGLLMGCPQVFVRLAGCNLKCSYCDTLESREPSAYCTLYPATGQRFDAQEQPNPISSEQLAELIEKYFYSRWVSFTGGEPLLRFDFIKASASLLKPRGYKIFLETNGTLPEALAECLECLDYISMDWKLFSATGLDLVLQHKRFLQQAMQKPCYIKMVVANNTEASEVLDAFKNIAAVNPCIPVILQIASPRGTCLPPAMDKMLGLQRAGMNCLHEVRILPQMHRLLGLT